MDKQDLLQIDPNLLDDAWMDQPKLYLEWAESLSDAKRELEECKNKLELVRATLATDIRGNPSSFGVSKVTENSVNEAMVQTEQYQDAVQRLADAKHEVGLLDAMVVALEHRKKALESMVYLHGQQYFAEPRVDVPENVKAEHRTRKTVKKAQEARRRRRRDT